MMWNVPLLHLALVTVTSTLKSVSPTLVVSFWKQKLLFFTTSPPLQLAVSCYWGGGCLIERFHQMDHQK